MKRIFISTGEVSGDLQGALLIAALKRQAKAQNIDLEISALGGDRMAAAGATIIANTTRIGSMGLLESVPYILPTIKVQNQAKEYLKNYPPDLVILIDYVGPNLGMGSYMKKYLPHVPVIYYIAPQVWVWSLNGQDTAKIISISDKIISIFPQEYEYFKKQGANVTFAGHPFVDRMANVPTKSQARQMLNIPENETAIALLPASRQQELKYLLPDIFAAAKMIQEQLPQVRFYIPVSLPNYRYPMEKAVEEYGLNATLVENSIEILASADLAITKSGTVNLELALLNIPQVVIYKVNKITGWIAENILKFSIPFMSPPNLILMREIVPEFLQYYATKEIIVEKSLELLLNPQRREQIFKDYQEMRQALGEIGVCDRAAKEILNFQK
jgi:lipid-A-disaccharide synthase